MCGGRDSLIKPVEVTGNHAFWEDERPLYLDFTTFWDMTKNHLPLVLLLEPKHACDIINATLAIYEQVKRPANMILMRPLEHLESQDIQGFALAYPFIGHAAGMNLPGVDWARALRILAPLMPVVPQEGKEGIDYALAAFSLAQVARAAGDAKAADEWAAKAEHWKIQYSQPAGKICRGKFYEGESWNYSFMVWYDIPGLIDMCGGRDSLIADLDAFFGYNGSRMREVHHAAFNSDVLPEIQRFEGLNNESDMEVPYIYGYLGRHDRVCEVVRTTLKHRFTTGRGGMPGNEDSGALSSWYVLSAIGLYPAVAQGLYLIGSPIFKRSELDVPGGTLVIETKGNSDTAIYVQSAKLNGQPIDRAYLHPKEVLGGGVLELQMGEKPSGWGRDLPPSPYWATPR
jgi:putative alpha-1,2-mannosidase